METIEIEAPCAHVGELKIKQVHRPGKACEDCVPIGGRWLHLRECLTCGHVACCDSSPNQHASKHFHATRHPLITSLEQGETWVWCYVDEAAIAG